MNKRNFIRRLGWFFLVVLLILVYLVVYFFPTMININRSKREIKDIKLRIQDLGRVESTISLTNKREKILFKQTNRKFWNKIPKVKNKKAKAIFLQKIGDHIMETAAREKIKNLIIMTNGERPEVLGHIPAKKGEKKLLFNQLNHFRQTSRKNPQNNFEGASFYANILENLSSQALFIGFCGEMKNATQLINRLPHFSYFIIAEKILISAGKPFPLCMVKLRAYYREKAKITFSQKHTRANNICVDFNSPLLLQPVYFNSSGSEVKRALPGEWGRAIFIKSREGDK